MSVVTGARNALALLVGAGLVLAVVNFGSHDRSEANKDKSRPGVTASKADDRVQVTIKVATHGYPMGDKWPVVNWKISGKGTESLAGAEPTFAIDYSRDLGRHPKGTHVLAWVVPPSTAKQSVQLQGISLFFNGKRVDGPLISAENKPIPGPAFTAGNNTATVEKIIV